MYSCTCRRSKYANKICAVRSESLCREHVAGRGVRRETVVSHTKRYVHSTPRAPKLISAALARRHLARSPRGHVEGAEASYHVWTMFGPVSTFLDHCSAVTLTPHSVTVLAGDLKHAPSAAQLGALLCSTSVEAQLGTHLCGILEALNKVVWHSPYKNGRADD